MNLADSWAVLVASLQAQPVKTLKPQKYVNVTQGMRNHCSKLRAITFGRQREEVARMILNVMRPGVAYTTAEIAVLTGKQRGNSAIKRRLLQLADSGTVRGEIVTINCTRAYVWEVPC